MTPQPDDDWDGFVVMLGRRLQDLRARRGWSQTETARRAGISRFSYQRYEFGESRIGSPANPSLRALLALARIFDVTIDELIDGTVD